MSARPWLFHVKPKPNPAWHPRSGATDVMVGEEQERMLHLAAVALKDLAFRDLRDALEGQAPHGEREGPDTSKAACPSWDVPFIELHIERPVTEAEPFAVPEFGDNATFITLRALSRGAVRRDGGHGALAPILSFPAYQTMTEEELDGLLDGWLSPVPHGDGYQLEDDRLVPGDDASMEVRDGERCWRAALVYEVGPLVLDTAARTAYHVLRIGLPWAGDMGSPAMWGAAERETLWTAILRSFEAMAAYYQGDAKELPRAIEVRTETVSPMVGRAVGKATASGTLTTASPLAAAHERITSGITRRVFPVAFGATRADRAALDFVRHSHHLRLPRSWSNQPRWEDLVRAEIDETLDRLGQDAFRDRRAEEQDPSAYARLRKSYKAGRTEPVAELTPEAARRLRLEHGERGFLDVDPRGRQALYRCVRDAKGNLLEVWLSWTDMAGPLIREGLQDGQQEIFASPPERDTGQPLLFDDLDADQRRRLDRRLERLNLHEHGRSVMEAILNVVGRYGRNPVEISAEAFRTLLWPGTQAPRDWKQTVERILGALMGMTCSWRTGGLKGEAVFVNSWQYAARGHGGHGEGVYIIGVTPPFIGCLRAFEGPVARLRSGMDAVVYDFSRKLPKEDRQALSYAVYDAGGVFYHAAAGLTAHQQNLMHWVERNITQRGDPANRRHRWVQVNRTAPDAREPRLYTHEFCPLIPAGRSYVGVLGHFEHAPEAGRTLYGTGRKGGKSSEGHAAGLVVEAGYLSQVGGESRFGREVVRRTLGDLDAVVVRYLGGIVAGKLTDTQGQDRWIPLDRFTELDDRMLRHRLKMFVFLPSNWNQRRRARFEEATGCQTTESIAEAEAAAWGIAAAPLPTAMGEAAPAVPEEAACILEGAKDGWRGLSLPQRLHAAMTQRGLKRTDLARIFGVSKSAVTQWFYDLRPEEEHRRAIRIPDDLAALMVRWLETGVKPTMAELAVLPSRQRTPRRGPRRQDVQDVQDGGRGLHPEDGPSLACGARGRAEV